MTADEWQTSNDALEMLKAVRGKWRDQQARDRRLRRYLIACGRTLWPLLPQDDSRRGVETAERHLDGEASDEERNKVEWDAEGAAFAIEYNVDPSATAAWVQSVEALPPAQVAALIHTDTGRALGTRDLLLRAAYFADWVAGSPHRSPKWHVREHAPFLSARLLRCVFANPLRRPTMLPAWRTGDVVGLARGIDEDRAYDRMPLLGDALMDAGADEQLLVHARADGHVRGCWLVDLVLDKE